ncbi:hypothetical protein Cs7R123_04230 [Catellatospora sp. TT07R-123]|uniref:PLAT/LH2 domain-containing protein n=1 Tax=Catellatospora sp. TT07R-123 TaxID=2733863 RepID=UPI001B0CAB4B|nr:PLAT/LH2 domain-containing protein [Catellatospora sp. TT07R-123]GHJ43081.1 hypothetical protein Cs7R123_04230 [Catellatospora sp. TT07R-123]
MNIRAALSATAIAITAVVTFTGQAASAAPATPADTPSGVVTLAGPGYNVTVRTGNFSGAGTDANIYIRAYGLLAISSEKQLDDSRDNFERNSTETFGVTSWADLGRIDGIGLRKDGSGSEWYPEWVSIQNLVTGAVAFCSVYTWYPDAAATNYYACAN